MASKNTDNQGPSLASIDMSDGPETRALDLQRPAESSGLKKVNDVLIRTITPIILAFIVSGIIIWFMGVNPFTFFGDIFRLGIVGTGWQHSLIAMAPLLLVALGLIIAFRAQLWNLGFNGAYLIAAAMTAGLAPSIMTSMPFYLGILVLFVLAFLLGVAFGYLPALLRAKYGTNEIVTSLMMSFIGINLANLLVKGPFLDRSVTLPQTTVLEPGLMLPFIPGTRVHIGVLISLAIVVVFYFILMRSSFGLKIDTLGASAKAATHVGIDSKRMIIIVFVLSTGMIAIAAVVDILGLWGYMRTNWNPTYGDKILPFVFLARLNPLAAIPLVGFYAILTTGGTIASQQAGISVDFLLILVALILFFMVVIEYFGERRGTGKSYLPRGLFRSSARKGKAS